MPLDLLKLTNVREQGGGVYKARCPQCAAEGGDTTGNHLRIDTDRSFGCAADKSRAHWDLILSLAGDGNATETPLDVDPPEPEIELDRVWPVDVLDRLIKDDSYWVKRGVAPEVVVGLRGGVATEGQMKDRWVIPIFNDNGEICGFTGRTLKDAKPRWKHLGKVSDWVWGGLAEVEETGQAILVEGPGCFMGCASRGRRNAIPLWGVNLSQAVLAFLITADPKDIVIATNNDQNERQVGQRAAAKIKHVLDRLFDPGVARVVLPETKDLLDQHGDDQAWACWEKRLDLAAIEETLDL